MAKSHIIKELISKLGISVHAFEKQIGASNTSIQKAVERDSDISTKTIQKIVSRYPNVNKDWLLTGEGDMMIDDTYLTLNQPKHPTGDEIGQQKAIGERQKRRIPLLGDAVAGTDIELNSEPITYTEQYIDVGDLLRDSEFAFTVYGNSMTPNYPPGSILGLKRNFDSFIQEGEIYVIQTKSNRIFKRLYTVEDNNEIYLGISDNNMLHEGGHLKGKLYYPAMPIPKQEIIRIFDVTGMIKRTRNSEIFQRQK